jgi:hypothetical protein
MSKNISLVETSGEFFLLDNGIEISANRPTVVTVSNFVSGRAHIGQIKLLGKLKDDVTDEMFMEFVKSSTDEKTKKVDMSLAVESFLSKHGLEEVTSEPDKKEAAKPAKPSEAAKANK